MLYVNVEAAAKWFGINPMSLKLAVKRGTISLEYREVEAFVKRLRAMKEAALGDLTDEDLQDDY